MQAPSTLIYNADIVNERRRFNGYLTITPDGLIGEVAPGHPSDELIESAATAVDLGGMMLMPGVIDTHVHFREPGLTHKATIESESIKALQGGVTSIIEMPNTKPPTTSLEAWQWKMDRAAATSRVNYAFYIGATSENIDLIKSLDYSRVAAIKLFLGSSTGNMLLNTPDILRRLLTDSPALIAVHAESEELIAKGRKWAIDRFGEGNVPLSMHSVIRSRRACVEATRQIIGLARQTGARLHVLHISTADELELFAPEPAADKLITAETCPNYLLHTALDYPKMGAAVKCNPAVKLPSDRDALRRAVASGVIDTIATDHAPHTPADKLGDALTAASGIASIDRALPSMLQLAEQGWFTVEDVVEKMAHNPATIYRIDRRGFLRKGYHADLTIVDGINPVKVFINGKIATPADSNAQPLEFNV